MQFHYRPEFDSFLKHIRHIQKQNLDSKSAFYNFNFSSDTPNNPPCARFAWEQLGAAKNQVLSHGSLATETGEKENLHGKASDYEDDTSSDATPKDNPKEDDKKE